MTTEAHPTVLNRDFAITGSVELIETACPLLREVVNHGTHVYLRCQRAPTDRGGIDEDVAPLALYRNVLETTDGIEELLSRSCVLPAVPLLRVSFEAGLGLEYITEADFGRRGLSWIYTYGVARLRTYRMIAGQGQSGQEFQAAWTKEFDSPFSPEGDIGSAVENMESLLRKPHLAEVAKEFRKRKKARRSTAWYSLFDGPGNLRELAERQGRLAEYDFLYRYWSTFSHPQNLEHKTRLSSGLPGVKSIRYAGDLILVATHAVNLQLRATRTVLKRYRPGESVSRWYERDVRPGFQRLLHTDVAINALEEKWHPSASILPIPRAPEEPVRENAQSEAREHDF